MEIERAIEILKSRSKFVAEINIDAIVAYKMAIEALEKQIPKHPKMNSWCPAYCPSCGSELSENVGDGYYKHWRSKKVCDCGQKLNWNSCVI